LTLLVAPIARAATLVHGPASRPEWPAASAQRGDAKRHLSLRRSAARGEHEGIMGRMGMNRALREQCILVQRLLAEAATDEIDTRYKVGVIIRSIMEAKEGKYGEHAIECLAAALGHNPATLYRFAAVARMWSESEMTVLSRRPNAHGEPLSWSHWMELARAKATWRQWLEVALLESWSVRRLAREIDAELADKGSAKTPAEDTTRAALVEAVKHGERTSSEMQSFAALLDRLEHERRRPREIAELLVQARQVFGDVSRRSVEIVTRVSVLAPDDSNGTSRGQVKTEN
jgi:hypothetical protein